MKIENVVIVSMQTRLEGLKKRFNTISQAKFYIEREGGDFQDFKEEASNMKLSLSNVQKELSREVKVKMITKDFLPNYIFSEKDIVVVVGQDGLVANTAKYAHNIPIIGVNPDPDRYDGVLLPFKDTNLMQIVRRVMKGNYNYKMVTMAEAKLNHGQRLLAFNDIFIGPRTHRSARYQVSFKGITEAQSSSGIIVSTGAGSTGWLSSLINMANGISKAFAKQSFHSFSKSTGRAKLVSDVVPNQQMAWDTDKLTFIVREPFASRTTQINLAAGFIHGKEKLVIESLMPQDGVIFSDGIETDYLHFTSGVKVEIGIAKEKAKLVIP